MKAAADMRRLRAAARACGIAASYIDYRGARVWTPAGTLRRLIGVVRGSAPGAAEPLSLLRAVRADSLARSVPAALAAWGGALKPFWIWLDAPPPAELGLALEGEEGCVRYKVRPLDAVPRVFSGRRYWRVRVACEGKLAFGYYTLRVAGQEIFVIAAPERLEPVGRGWGVFAPCYALPPRDGQGIGGYRELRRLAREVKNAGGAFVGTLPLLPVFYEGGAADSSPYAPVSRLFWNELLLDVSDLPAGMGAPPGQYEEGDYIDYRQVHARKKKILQESADAFFSRYPGGDEGFRAYKEAAPHLESYARFRAGEAAPEKREAALRYHLFCQYACSLQFAKILRAECASIYLDYPFGVHPEGYDARRFPSLFLDAACAGAPPDLFFLRGQNWGFRPFDPRALARERFSYFRLTLRHFLSHAGMLRLDHIMGFYRLYCIPRGRAADEGGYIYYPFQPFLAILCLEAARHGAVLVGENLGTVPAAVDAAMRARGICRMWVGQFALQAEGGAGFDGIEPCAVAGLNTHDMSPFRAYFDGRDIKAYEAQDLLSSAQAGAMLERRGRALRRWQDCGQALRDCLARMAASPARYVIVNMADLLGETRPQNIPGTVSARNWSLRLPPPWRAVRAGARLLRRGGSAAK
jgi:4-alpha-glucanotransferase